MKHYCPCCGAGTKESYEFNESAYGDSYMKIKDEALKLKKHKLKLLHCNKCGTVTLEDQLDKSKTAEAFVYLSSITVGLKEVFSEIAGYITKSEKIISALDIGCNDGTFLDILREKGVKDTSGVEPAKKASEICESKGHRVYKTFFDEDFRIKQEAEDKKYDLISLNYVYANMEDPGKVFKLSKSLLSDDGRILITTGYHPKQFERGMVDYVYHEHYHYYTIKGLKLLCESYGMEIEKVIDVNSKGGSISLILRKTVPTLEKENLELKKRINNERKWVEKEKLLNACKKYELEIKDLKKKIIKYQEKGYKIIGFGASLSTSIMCNVDDLGSQLEYLVDDNKQKQGLYSPGYGLEVKSPEIIKKLNKVVIVMLAWQHKKSILEKYAQLESNEIVWIGPYMV